MTAPVSATLDGQAGQSRRQAHRRRSGDRDEPSCWAKPPTTRVVGIPRSSWSGSSIGWGPPNRWKDPPAGQRALGPVEQVGDREAVQLQDEVEADEVDHRFSVTRITVRAPTYCEGMPARRGRPRTAVLSATVAAGARRRMDVGRRSATRGFRRPVRDDQRPRRLGHPRTAG